MTIKTTNSIIRGFMGTKLSKGPILTTITDIDQEGTGEETVVGITGTRIVHANYPLIQHDFPHLSQEALKDRFKKLKGRSRTSAIKKHIDDWLLRNTSFISERQSKKAMVNSPVPVTHHRVKAWRPPAYGRALVFSIRENAKAMFMDTDLPAIGKEDRLLDIKGIGVAPDQTPNFQAHSNGLLRLGFAIVEFLMQEVIQLVLEHQGSQVSAVPVYAIIDTGIDILHEDGQKWPAGLMVRRAHQRPQNSAGLMPYGSTGQHAQLEIERQLRKYGITSVNGVSRVKVWKENGNLQIEYGGKPVDFLNEEQKKTIEEVSHIQGEDQQLIFDGINVQHTREISLKPLKAQLVDFGSYLVEDGFKNPILSLVSDKLLRWGGSIWKGYEEWVEPDPNLCVPYELWGDSGPILGYELSPDFGKLEALSYGLAKDFRTNRITREMLTGILQAYLSTVTSRLK